MVAVIERSRNSVSGGITRLRAFLCKVSVIAFTVCALIRNINQFSERSDLWVDTSGSTQFSSASEDISSDCKLAYENSFGFFDDISEREWILRRNITHRMSHHLLKEDPFLPKEKPAEWYQGNWNPDFSCTFREAVGGPGDGLKWMCDPHRLNKDGCLVYSIGSLGNFAFEVGLHNIAPKCEIHTFDPKDHSKGLKRYKANDFVTLHRWGLKPSYNSSDKMTDTRFSTRFATKLSGLLFKTLKETMRDLGHEGRQIDVFKIDCEGCEWKTYKDWIDSSIHIQQILVEVHDTPKVTNVMFNDLHNAGYVIFNKEPNIQYGGGSCIEYSFLRLHPSFFNQD